MNRFLLISFFAIIFNANAVAFELLMYNSNYCVYCKNFFREVAPDFNIPNLPLIIIDENNQPEWFKKAIKQKKIKPLRGTPTFIIWNDLEKYEFDRIAGYGDKDNFYKQLNEIFVIFLNENDLSN